MIDNILKTTSLPAALHDTLRQNIQTRAFDDQGLSTISAYISATIISVLLRAAAFLICFFLCFLALHILINLIDHVFYFPVLRHLNGRVYPAGDDNGQRVFTARDDFDDGAVK